MTIKEFATLLGCNPQTLRYYDQMGLLKPSMVDESSGYRYYDEEQAVAFIRIKNMQKAGFSIKEIKQLAEKDDFTILKAFELKIQQEEEKLRQIKNIMRSYQTEMNEVQEKINELREQIMRSMREFDPTVEFGIDKEQYEQIVSNVDRALEKIAESDPKEVSYNEFNDGDTNEESEYIDILNNGDFTVVYEKHGWKHVKDFFEEWCDLGDAQEYALLFKVDQTKGTYNQAFGNTILGMLLAKNGLMIEENSNSEKRKRKALSLTWNTEDSDDGQNHFYLLKRN